MKRVRLAVIVAVAALVFSACKVDVTLGVRVADDGSGEVRAAFVLDEEAVDAVGGELGPALRVADLIQAGWEVDVDDEVDGGGAEAVAIKRFGTPEQLGDVIDELSGETGPFRDFRVTRDRGFFTTDYEFTGTVDLEGGVGATALDPGDDALATELEGEGVDIEALRDFLSERLAGVFDVQVIVAMPGDGSNNAPVSAGGEPSWSPDIGETAELRASSSSLDVLRIFWLAFGAVVLLLAVAVFTGRIVLGRRAGGEPRPDDDLVDPEEIVW